MEIIGPIIVILFIVVPLIGVVASKMREMSQPPARPGGQGDNRRIQEQIDEFLRRAGQRRAGQPPAAAQEQPPAPVEVLEDDQIGSGVGRQSQKYLDTSDFRRRSEALGGKVAQGDEQFTQQVKSAFSGEVGSLSTRRGESSASPEVVEADVIEAEPVEADEVSRPTLQALPVAGSGLAELLGSPDNIVHAIIMSEILRQPEW